MDYQPINPNKHSIWCCGTFLLSYGFKVPSVVGSSSADFICKESSREIVPPRPIQLFGWFSSRHTLT